MASPRKSGIVLSGYYGKANFGDDILLQVTHSIIRQHAPDVPITVLVDGGRGGYLAGMLGSEVEIIAPGTRFHYEMIVHGGGGVFFDFSDHRLADRLLEQAVRLIGSLNYVRLDHLVRALINRPHLSCDQRIGLGIGVGTFSLGSPKMRQGLPILVDFDALWVRDSQSVENLRRFGLGIPVHTGSDLAFLTEYWCPGVLPHRPARMGQAKLGVILRDWPYESADAKLSLSLVLEELATSHEVTVLVFDENADPRTISSLARFPVRIWQPATMSIGDFAAVIADQDVLLTSRAHGAICGACLGVPSVVIEIEPKLRAVHEMLPQSSLIVSPSEPGTWTDEITRAAAISATAITADVRRNRELSEKALRSTLSSTRWGRDSVVRD